MLEHWDLSAFQEAAELLVSEMVTNAVQASTDPQGRPVYLHGRMPIVVVRLVATKHSLILEVWDSVPTLPVVRQPEALEERGRGLLLVETLAYRWDWKTAAHWPGKCVWAELRSPSPAPAERYG